jgi:predicted DNA-binding protein (UPF0251 family)
MRRYRRRGGRGRKSLSETDCEFQLRGRPLKEIVIEDYPKISKITPHPTLSENQLVLTIAEYEAMRLIDLKGLNQEEAGLLMKVSRGTIWRLLDSGREKIMKMLSEGMEIVIEKQEEI